jgi:hypothetical protein
MTGASQSAEIAFAEAVEQLQMRAVRRDRWSSRAVFWTAVRFGVDRVLACPWEQARDRWQRLWDVAVREHLPPIPGIPEAENMPETATVAEKGIASLRAMVARPKGRDRW